MRSSPLSCQMIGASFWSRALCRYDEPFGHNLIFKSHFRIFFRPPPSNMASRRHFPEVPSHWHFNRRRPEHGRTLFCYLFFVGSSNNFFLALAVKKYRFWGENHFFSPPCVTPLGSVCKFWRCTRPGLPGKKNRKSIGQ